MNGFIHHRDGIHEADVRQSDGAGIAELHAAGECPRDCTLCAPARRTPDLATFQAWARRNRSAAMTVVQARAFASVERERVDAYTRPIFDAAGFVYGSQFGQPDAGQPLTDPKHLYLCDDEPRVADYFAALDVAHRAHGFTGPAGHCPALVAEMLVIKAENALIDLAHDLFQVDACQLIGDDRTKYLDLLIGACLVGTRRKP